jgi:hypothetical protein
VDIKGKISRKEFLSVTGLALAGTFTISSPFLSFLNKGKYRIQPIAGKKYSPSFLAFCERARFHSVKEAVKCVKDQTSEFQVVVEA